MVIHCWYSGTLSFPRKEYTYNRIPEEFTNESQLGELQHAPDSSPLLLHAYVVSDMFDEAVSALDIVLQL